MRSTDDILGARIARHLRAYRRAIEDALPGRVERVLLFGSRARGDAREASDYDVIVFVSGLNERERRRIRRILAEKSLPHIAAGIDITGLALPAEYLNGSAGRLPGLVHEALRDGVPIS